MSVSSFQVACAKGAESVATVWLEPTDHSWTGSTHDPFWFVQFPGKPAVRVEWLGFLGWDEQTWWVKVRASWNGVHNKTWYDVRGPHSAPVPNNDPSDLPKLDLVNNTQLGYLNAEGARWLAAIYPAADNENPKFDVYPQP